MQQEITYEWTLDFMKRVTRKFIFRYVGKSLAGLLVLFLIGFAALLNEVAANVAWIAVVVPLMVFGLWFRYYLQVIDLCLKESDRSVVIRIEPETISFSMTDCSSTLRWSVIRKIWVFPEALLIFTRDDQSFSAIPSTPLNEETRQFILTKVKEHGGKVE